jgi:hypothetical protein
MIVHTPRGLDETIHGARLGFFVGCCKQKGRPLVFEEAAQFVGVQTRRLFGHEDRLVEYVLTDMVKEDLKISCRS